MLTFTKRTIVYSVVNYGNCYRLSQTRKVPDGCLLKTPITLLI